MVFSGSEKALEELLRKARRDPEILAVLLFGSHVRCEADAASDVDVCLVLFGSRFAPGELSEKKLAYLAAADLDVHLFQQLPLSVRRRVLKEGKVLFVRDEDQLYELAFRTAQAFEDFRRYYEGYLEEVARARS